MGTLGLILAMMKRSANPLADPAYAAEKIATQQRTLYGGLHEYRDATDADFDPLDRKFYEDATAQLTARGYRVVRDVVNETISGSWPKNHVVLRCLIGDHGTTMGAIYHVKLANSSKVIKIVEFDSELNDGSFVATANNAEFERTLGYPFVDRLQFFSSVPASEVLESHRTHLKSVLVAKPEVAPVPCNTYRDLRAAQDRLQLLRNAHRNSPDFDYHAEWQKIAGRPLRENETELVDRVANTLQGRDAPNAE